MIRKNSNKKGNEMNNDFTKLVKHLMAKGFSKLEAKRLAQQCTTKLALIKAMAIIEERIQQIDIEIEAVERAIEKMKEGK